ncbi:MAG: Lipopolysaccharide core heptosyltransferase I [uncultured Ramlibacter sp.]|uniref:Lipopolysaccharide heptosyltransferase 1 n=1 Tax=uncultured Ramlibacter sp. TaxID=260755 RepID=A0A6J4Q3F5_9BURK|nr:MAG: Lipopolysaccharide core heptosyltransferase I [uncultured Ramlibacter sp.]
MQVLIVKLSSLGDVVHAMPAVQDMRSALPGVEIDWVVERAFAPLVERCEGIRGVVACELRRWRTAPLSAETRSESRAFRAELQARLYDAVIDLQGLTKSALIARTARLAPGGKRFALANQTEGSSYEAPTRWLADVAVPVQARSHAVQRSRELCATALGYALPADLRYGLRTLPVGEPAARPCVALVHGTSRADKRWPAKEWIGLGHRLVGEGFDIGLPHGSDAERKQSDSIAAAIGAHAEVWPRLDLGALADRLAGCVGVIGVDSGLSHIAVALDLRHVQVYNFDTAWRTGPVEGRQRSVYGSPFPPLDAVWDAWRATGEAG